MWKPELLFLCLKKKTVKEKKKHYKFNKHIKLSIEYSYKHFLKTVVITGNSNLQDSVHWQ